jgi:eukaryotic-like serine/threonine-protein kinase
MNSDSDSLELERIMARYLEDLEMGRPVDEAALRQRHAHLEPDLSDFLQTHQRFMVAAQSAREEIQSAHSDPLETTYPFSPSSFSTQSIPRQLGPYEIIEEIDRGGMGIVYKARHKSLDRIVALKLIRSGELASDEEVQRFHTEAAAAAALQHPGIVPIFEVGMLQGHYYYTMAYIEGKPLSAVLKDGAIDRTSALKILTKLCQAVEHAHQHGIYHRDLKPANVLLDSHDQPIVIDFGLAKVASRNSELTVTGQVLGTPAYMAPERAQGRASPGPAEDIYSLGAIAYFMLSGQPPYSGPTPFDVLLQVLDSEPPRPSQIAANLDKHADYLCLKALRKSPAERYLRCSEMAEDAQRLLQGEPIDNQRRTISEKLEGWWNREPILVAHLFGIGATASIIALAYSILGGQQHSFIYRMTLFAIWLLASFVLQYWVRFAQHREFARLTWLTVDVVLYTWLISFAEPPRSLLLIGYPMMIVASSLYYRKRFVIFTTISCILGFMSLVLIFPHKTYEGFDIDTRYQTAAIAEAYQGLDIDFFRHEYSAIFLTGLVVISLSLLSVIRRVRRLSLFDGDEN